MTARERAIILLVDWTSTTHDLGKVCWPGDDVTDYYPDLINRLEKLLTMYDNRKHENPEKAWKNGFG